MRLRRLFALREDAECSFCGKSEEQVEGLIAAPTRSVSICNECVALFSRMVNDIHHSPTGSSAWLRAPKWRAKYTR